MTTTLLAFSKADYELDAKPALLAWLDAKMVATQREIDDAIEMKGMAKAAKIDTKRLTAIILRGSHRMRWYQKLRAATEAGYVMLPDLPMRLFAVRVADRMTLDRQEACLADRREWRGDRTSLAGEASDVGVGEYVSPRPVRSVEKQWEEQQSTGTVRYRLYANERHRDVVLPLQLLQPALVAATDRAMATKIFDEIGLCIPVTGHLADPMILGRVYQGPRARGKAVCFNVGWFVDVGDLE